MMTKEEEHKPDEEGVAAMKNETSGKRDEPGCTPPYWLSEVMWEDLPKGLQAAIEGIVGPGYEDLVMAAPDAMERLAGVSVVHLTHLEILDQMQLALESPAAKPEDRRGMVESHVRLVGAKTRAMAFLHRLREARKRSASANSIPRS